MLPMSFWSIRIARTGLHTHSLTHDPLDAARRELPDDMRKSLGRATLHCNTTSLVNRLVTSILTGYQLGEVY